MVPPRLCIAMAARRPSTVQGGSRSKTRLEKSSWIRSRNKTPLVLVHETSVTAFAKTETKTNTLVAPM